MKRELKFSAYDRHEEKWVYAGNAYELSDLFYGYSDGQLKWLRQYTGVGTGSKEIYEGDIVAYTEHQETLKGHIYFQTGTFWVSLENGSIRLLANLSLDWLEVIGNKFEDPDLMEEVI